MRDHYVWLIWSSAFLVPWLALYWAAPAQRRAMIRTSLATALFGLTEPLFVPAYWNPPSLFNLAQRTGFDIESLIFCFAIGGVGSVLYNAITRRRLAPLPIREVMHPRHRYHRAALYGPLAVFPALYFFPWNPIYPGIAAMAAGAIAAMLCRPDLVRKTLIGGGLFLAYYVLFMLGLKGFSPGYIERVWNLQALSGLLLYGIPVEELLFGFSFGMYWAGAYEHVTWKHVEDSGAGQGPAVEPSSNVTGRNRGEKK